MAASITKRDWEDYMALGRVPKSVREVVLRSWQRSGEQGIAGLKRAPKLTEGEMFALRQTSRRLRRSAKSGLNKAGYLLNHTGNMLLLCDAQGVVLDVAGDARTQARGQENHLHIGGNWSEGSIGTNAIGTAIHLRRPVTVQTVEHFCEEIQRWNCAATPITDPSNGRLMGILDISWLDGFDHANASALSAALAMQIEGELSRNFSQEREALIEHLQMRRLRRGAEPMLVLDRSGADVYATEGFARFCANDAALGVLRARIPELIDQPPEIVIDAISECVPGTDLEIINRDDESIGVLLSLRRNRGKPLHDPEAELTRIGRIGGVTAELCAQAQRLARTRIPILIEGETGTGKSYLAQAIHRASAQSAGPLETLDCSTLTAEALRADLARETWRGAMLGRLAESGGSLCLLRPSAMPLDAQKLLLSLIELLLSENSEGLRLLTLCSVSLYDAMQEGRFRSDLYYRLGGARLSVPPLRSRRDEIVPSLKMMAQRHAEREGGRDLRFTSGALAILQSYGWPGNLREMANLVAALDALSPTGLIDEKSLPPEYRLNGRAEREETLRDVEKLEIVEAISEAQGNLTEVARRLGIARSTLYLKLDSYGIARPRKH